MMWRIWSFNKINCEWEKNVLHYFLGAVILCFNVNISCWNCSATSSYTTATNPTDQESYPEATVTHALQSLTHYCHSLPLITLCCPQQSPPNASLYLLHLVQTFHPLTFQIQLPSRLRLDIFLSLHVFLPTILKETLPCVLHFPLILFLDLMWWP